MVMKTATAMKTATGLLTNVQAPLNLSATRTATQSNRGA
jgi:hypothetical protein